MGGRREVSIVSHRPVTSSDLKRERSFLRGSVSTGCSTCILKTLVGGPVRVSTHSHPLCIPALILSKSVSPRSSSLGPAEHP